MNINYRQSQFELFPEAAKGFSRENKPRYIISGFTLSLDNIVIFSIVVLMFLVLAFSLGVEKGKHSVLKTPDLSRGAQAIAAVNTGSVPAVTVPLPKVKAAVPLLQSGKSLESKQISLPLAADMDDFYTIQVASYKKEEFAQKEAVSLRKKGYQIFILPKGEHSILCVGRFSQKGQAKESLSKLKKAYKDCLVRRL